MFNKRTKIKELLTWTPQGQEVTVMGWVRTFRNNQFVALNDGSTNNNLQIVIELGKYNDEFLKRITTSASLRIKGSGTMHLTHGQSMASGGLRERFSQGYLLSADLPIGEITASPLETQLSFTKMQSEHLLPSHGQWV